jgi:hypothetical protein
MKTKKVSPPHAKASAATPHDTNPTFKAFQVVFDCIFSRLKLSIGTIPSMSRNIILIYQAEWLHFPRLDHYIAGPKF